MNNRKYKILADNNYKKLIDEIRDSINSNTTDMGKLMQIQNILRRFIIDPDEDCPELYDPSLL